MTGVLALLSIVELPDDATEPALADVAPPELSKPASVDATRALAV